MLKFNCNDNDIKKLTEEEIRDFILKTCNILYP